MRVSGRKLGLIGAVAVAAITAASLLATAQQSPAAQPDTLILAGKLLADPGKARVTGRGDRALRLGRAHEAVADGKAGTLATVVQRKKSVQRRGNVRSRHRPAHACPAWVLSIQASRPSRPRARS